MSKKIMAEDIPLEDLSKGTDDDNDDGDGTFYQSPNTSTSILPYPDDYGVAENSFGGSETDPLLDMENEKDKVWRDILNKLPNAKPTFLFKYNEWGKIVVAIPRKPGVKETWHELFDANEDINKKLPATILNALGKKAEEVVQANDDLLSQLNEQNEEIRDLRNALDGLRAVAETSQFEIDRYVSIEKELRGMIERHQTTIAEKDSYLETAVREKIDAKLYAETLLNDLKELKAEVGKNKKDLVSLKKIEQSQEKLAKRVKTYDELSRKQFILNEDQMADIGRKNDEILKNMPLRDRVKYIFKKYGFTVFAVMSAVGVIIGVIVSNLSKGLSTLGRGVGNGLKTIGKKLGEILPGMVGAIVSFLFKTAGQVIGFLGENAWLLIMAVVLYFVESIKKKRK